MRIIETIEEMRQTAESLRRNDKKIGIVPTMGFLHEGHLSLVRKAIEISDVVVVSIFVNPTQFGPREDLDQYPRDFERDRALLEREGVHIIFFPDNKEMYPEGYSTHIQVRGLEDHLCGLSRKGHFVGVATVVTKLFNAVRPHYAVFGMKDYQQLKVIERMTKDLNMDTQIVPFPTVREEDGLAMSSRNIYLNPEERERGLLIYTSMEKIKGLLRDGERNTATLKREAEKILLSKGGVEIDYVSITDADTLTDIDWIEDRALLAIACHVGKTRLIDNTLLTEA